VEHEQGGRDRAAYGKETLAHLSAKLSKELGRGFSETNLKFMRQFFLAWKDRATLISQKTPAKLIHAPIRQKASDELETVPVRPSLKSNSPFSLSWSHYIVLLSIRDPNERSFYEIESEHSGWSVPELKRQLDTGLYERLALSRDKKAVRELSARGQVVQRPQDILKSPLVLEFLGLDEKPAYSENDLESAIIDKLQHFLLELGKGFLFEARQKRFTFDEDHFFVDLVFYNRLLRCYVLVDLKLDKLTHQDLGQMQMYVNHFDRHVKTAGENPTIGILLCKRKKEALIRLTLPKNANIFASQYQLYLPSKEDLRQRLLEWTCDEGPIS
jgi:predicted nuclease of restriction endonuclease-like (RecB) superfamily